MPRSFQSSPDPKAGRALAASRHRWQVAGLFQSSPDPKAGRHLQCCSGLVAFVVVSILARPEGRAPRGKTRERRQSLNVSILARPEGRAPRLVAPALAVVQPVSILARPEGRAPRQLAVNNVSQYTFQSSPDPKAWRHGAAAVLPARSRLRFNPRPTRRPGATTTAVTVPKKFDQFQSSPDPKAGRHPLLRCGNPDCRVVSILARPEGRAPRHDRDRQSSPTDGFNPRPTRRPGATSWTGSGSAR